MISKNQPCPCGSGKLYKRCCGIEFGKQKHLQPFKKYNSFDLLQTLAALTLVSNNHGKNLRLERAAIEVIQHYNSSKEKIPVVELQQYLNKNYSFDPDEDPPTNLFTEVIGFHGGNHLILPGISENPSFILNNLLPAILNWPEAKVGEEFKRYCQYASILLLTISNLMLRKARLNRYIQGIKEGRYITFPALTKLNDLKKAVFFSRNEISELFPSPEFIEDFLPNFLLDVRNSSLQDPNIREELFANKPLLESSGNILVVSPATLSFALINKIKEWANEMKCSFEMHNAFHEHVWNGVKAHLRRLDFSSVELPDISIPKTEFIRTILLQFDDDKIAIIHYICASFENFKFSSKELSSVNENIIAQINTTPGFIHFQFMDISIASGMMNDAMMSFANTKNSRSLFLTAAEIDILVQSNKSSALILWKFAEARDQQLPNHIKVSFLSFLDQYTIFKEHEDSFYLSDEGFDISKWQYGISQSFIEEAKLRNDEHFVTAKIDDNLVKYPVVRKDKYAPIYISPNYVAVDGLQLAVEGYKCIVWIKPILVTTPSDSLRHFYWELTDALAYWLWQIKSDINEQLASINSRCVIFTFDLDDPEKFENIDDSFVQYPDIKDSIITSYNDGTIHLVISHKLLGYFYGGNNQGDRLLLFQILKGINQALKSSHQIEFTDTEIDLIIDRNAPLGFKKKLIILHSRSNLLLDKSNLPKARYIKDYDVNALANSITTLLGSDCPPVGEIEKTDDKKAFVISVVIKGLLPHLQRTINQYNNTQLLERLISLNESLISQREYRRIMTPTRIACFVSQSQHIDDMLEEIGYISRTTTAIRCLIEHLAAEPAKGHKIVSITAIDELIAIMDAIISWGSIGDQLTYHLFDIKIGVLLTGRIGTQKDVSKEIFDPYFYSKTEESVQDALNSFKQEFPRAESTESQRKGKDIPEFLDKAFADEFGITLTRIASFIDILIYQGFHQNTAFAVIDRNTLFTHAQNSETPFDQLEFDNALSFLGLKERGRVTSIPKDCESFDISPWRFNRRLSLMRKPLIIRNTDDPNNPLIYWGFRQIIISRFSIVEQCITDRFKVSDKSNLKKALSKLSNKRGIDLVLKVLEKLKPDNVIIDSEVLIAKHGKLKNNTDIGDVDVLLIDLNSQKLYSLECKSFAPSRNIKEMIEECSKLIGSKSSKGLVQKHIEREVWLKNNLQKVSLVYKEIVTSFEVISAFVTREDMLFPHLKEVGIEMPFITLYDLETLGFSVLENLK